MHLSDRGVAGLLVAEVFAAILTALLVADVRAHTAVEQTDGVNTRGFRGPARITAFGGARIAVVGGSAAYGYGVEWTHSFPYYLERRLNEAWRKNFPHAYTEVINLAAVGDGAASYITTLKDFAYLKPDAVCIYDGYAGLGRFGVGGVRRTSAVFAKVGYLPILGDVLAHRAPWASPDRTVVDPLLREGATGDASCNGESRAWCNAIADTVSWVIGHGMTAVVVSPPSISARHAAQQASLAALLADRFHGDNRVQYVDMGRQVDVHDPDLSADGIHLTARGNQTLAESLVESMYAAVRSR